VGGQATTPTPVPVASTAYPASAVIPGPTFYPGYTITPEPGITPTPAPPEVSQTPGFLPGLLPTRNWEPLINLRPVTQTDVLVILLVIAVVLVILSGITYMMMFRQKKE
jgi:hypothetical protein